MVTTDEEAIEMDEIEERIMILMRDGIDEHRFIKILENAGDAVNGLYELIG